MAQTPAFVAKKVGDQYVVVPKNPPGTGAGVAWLGGGAALALYGIVRGGMRGTASLLIGAGMLYRGATGCSPMAWLSGRSRDGRRGSAGQTPSYQHDLIPHAQKPQDEVEEASMESFPASDPPARTATAAP